MFHCIIFRCISNLKLSVVYQIVIYRSLGIIITSKNSAANKQKEHNMRDETSNLNRFPAQIMKMFAAKCLQSMKLEKDDAILIADSLIQADLWGHPSHGIMRLF